MEMTTCEVADSVEAFKCQTEEQCDDCFIIDHQKECGWCEHYDHTVRTLAVVHQPSAYPSDAPSVDELIFPRKNGQG
jgi:recombinational DNA repair protein RecR